MCETTIRELFSFIEESPTPFHAVQNMCDELKKAGYTRLSESKKWQLLAGGRYYVTRNSSALIAFRIPKPGFSGFQIMASHSDSPLFKIKENPELMSEQHYVRLNIEKYGGMLFGPWFDRPLSIAGRVLLKDGQGITEKLIDAKRDLLMLPSLAIHMDRQANDGGKLKVQKELLPLFGDARASGQFLPLIAKLAGADPEDILSHDLYIYSRTPGTVWGASGEYISAGRLDDLMCAFASLKAFLQAQPGESVPLHCVFDNEEVGSHSRQGAASTFLSDTLMRICDAFGYGMADYRRLLSASFMLSADNAHAVHPNYPEKACPSNRPYMNEGIVLKYSAAQKYATDGVSAALFKDICKRAGVPVQVFTNHADIPGGSTLGNISQAQAAMHTVDIGLPQLAMHSPCETAGAYDTDALIKAATYFFECSFRENGPTSFEMCHA